MSAYGEPIEHRIPIEVALPGQAPHTLELCYFEWLPLSTSDRPATVLLLVHATGFHARCWDQVVAALQPGYRVIAVDQRGHGRSAKVPPYHWQAFGADLLALTEALKLESLVGCGHSMGGHVLTQLAIARPRLCERLLLLDPVILNPDSYPRRLAGLERPEDHPVSRRRGEFRDWRDMRDSLRGKGSYDLWDPAVMDDYCRYGLLPAESGEGFTLACPGLVEAAIYTGSTGAYIHDALGSVTAPVTVMRAPPREPDDQTMDFSKSPTWPALAAQFPKGTDRLLSELTHFIPMQAPGLVASTLGPAP